MTNPAPHTQKPINHKKDLLLLFSVPLGVILLALAMVYVPRWMAHPAYDFVYASCPDYNCRDSIETDQNGTIVRQEDYRSSASYAYARTKLYYYDIATDASRLLTIEEANKLKLSLSSRSPDGYTLSKKSSSSGFFLFGGGSESYWQLENGVKKRPVSIQGDHYYGDDTTVIGWVQDAK